MKPILLATSALAGFFAVRWITSRQNAPAETTEPPPNDVGEITRNFLMYAVLPVWLAAGIADWACHRQTGIETTTGAKESLMHLLMLAEAATPVLAGMFFEITSPVLALMIVSALLHDATALWDVSYAVTLREVTPIEQHVHSFLEIVPLAAVAFTAILHWPQLLALFGLGGHRPDWRIRRKRRPLPTRYVALMLGAQISLEWLPYLEELLRTTRPQAQAAQRLRAARA
ncbi:MAG: hypothetical protein J0H67_01795 [Rhodospirillales bacterium]|nr:hypothetical protein [Rhodospirillales bacterium]MBN8909287.1 hypothetical protein [Rhodospirillales bacterium]